MGVKILPDWKKEEIRKYSVLWAFIWYEILPYFKNFFSLKDPSFFLSRGASWTFFHVGASISIKHKWFDDLILILMNSNSFLPCCIVYWWFCRRSYFNLWLWSMRWWSVIPPICLITKIPLQNSFRHRLVFFLDRLILNRLLLFLLSLFFLASI